MCVCVCVLSNCFASWWTDRLPCLAADWRAGHSGGQQTLCLPWVMTRDRRHHRGPADTWVTLQVASLFHFPFSQCLFQTFFQCCICIGIFCHISVFSFFVCFFPFYIYSVCVCVFTCRIGMLLRCRLGNKCKCLQMPKKNPNPNGVILLHQGNKCNCAVLTVSQAV